MHNGIYASTYTPEDMIARMDQVFTVMDYIRRGVLSNEHVKTVLQAIISDDNVIVTPKVVTTPTGKIYHVVGNYDSAAAAIDAGNHDDRYGYAQNPEKSH